MRPEKDDEPYRRKGTGSRANSTSERMVEESKHAAWPSRKTRRTAGANLEDLPRQSP